MATNLIFMGGHLIIPSSRRQLVLKAIHGGIDKCKARAMHWPGMNELNEAIEQYLKKCSICNTNAKVNHKEPLLPHPFPMHLWHTIGADYFTFRNQYYLLIVDYFQISRSDFCAK